VEAAIDRLVRDPAADPVVIASDLRTGAGADRLEADLATAAADAHGLRRGAAARLLAGVATPRSLPLLWRLADDPQTRPYALPALHRLADPASLNDFQHREAERAARRRLVATSARAAGAAGASLSVGALLAPPEPSVGTAPAARIDPAAEALFAQLSARDADARVRAARELARRGDPAVTARLARMAEANVSRREALIALASSGRPEARAFMDRAARAPALAGPARSALLQSRTP
jgi:hypothetical protein